MENGLTSETRDSRRPGGPGIIGTQTDHMKGAAAMPSTQPPMRETRRSRSDAGPSRLEVIRDRLLALKKPVDAEIRAYPPPIPACDAQFNYLLDRRAALSRALVRLDAILKEGLPPSEEARALDAFIESCAEFDAEIAGDLCARIGQAPE